VGRRVRSKERERERSLPSSEDRRQKGLESRRAAYYPLGSMSRLPDGKENYAQIRIKKGGRGFQRPSLPIGSGPRRRKGKSTYEKEESPGVFLLAGTRGEIGDPAERKTATGF